MTEQPIGLIDTNILIHALTRDRQSEDCRDFLKNVRSGQQSFTLTAVVVFELTYALGRYKQQMSRAEIGEYLISIMAMPNVIVDDEFLFSVVRAWAGNAQLGFVDAYLAVRAERENIPVYTKNINHFAAFNVSVPDPLTS